MSTEPIQDATAPAANAHAWRLQNVMEQLDVNIARLALALDLSLSSKEGLSRAMLDGHAAAPGESHATHRADHLHAKLRGLLVLRYDLVKKCAEEIGPAATCQIMLEVESHMEAHGFKPGADGIDTELLRRPA